MNIDDVACAVLTIGIVLNNLTCSFIMTRDTFSNLRDERVERYLSRIAIDSVNQIRSGDDIYLVQSVYWKFTLCTSGTYK